LIFYIIKISVKNILLILILINQIVYSQKIDYNNFDSKHASKVLFDKLNDFRDTITKTGYGKDIEEVWPILKSNHWLLKLSWSELLYDTVVLPNALENVKQKKNYFMLIEVSGGLIKIINFYF